MVILTKDVNKATDFMQYTDDAVTVGFGGPSRTGGLRKYAPHS